jgi:hypothetical protein
VYAFIISHACYLLCSSHYPWSDYPNNIIQPSVTSSLTGRSILVTLLSNPLSLSSALAVEHQVSRLLKIRGKVIVLHNFVLF